MIKTFTFFRKFTQKSIWESRYQHLKIMILVVGKQRNVPCEIFPLQQILCLCQLNLLQIVRLSQQWGESWHPHFLGILLPLKQCCLCLWLPASSLQPWSSMECSQPTPWSAAKSEAPWSAANQLHGQRTGAFSWLLSEEWPISTQLNSTQRWAPEKWCNWLSSVFSHNTQKVLRHLLTCDQHLQTLSSKLTNH